LRESKPIPHHALSFNALDSPLELPELSTKINHFGNVCVKDGAVRTARHIP
jgi:hypothetical protein